VEVLAPLPLVCFAVHACILQLLDTAGGARVLQVQQLLEANHLTCSVCRNVSTASSAVVNIFTVPLLLYITGPPHSPAFLALLAPLTDRKFRLPTATTGSTTSNPDLPLSQHCCPSLDCALGAYRLLLAISLQTLGILPQ
jgi:hypothetical protein